MEAYRLVKMSVSWDGGVGKTRFCQLRVSNPINHLYLPLPRNVLAIQETLGKEGRASCFAT